MPLTWPKLSTHLAKAARSVSLYPYNQSKIWHYINYATQINIAKGIAKIVTKMRFFQKVKLHKQQNKKNKTLAGAGN